MTDQQQTTASVDPPPRAASAAAVVRATPGITLLVAAGAAAVWAAVALSWSVFAVVMVCLIDGLIDGLFAWLRARASFAAGSATDRRDQVLVREFIKTYLIVVAAQAIVAYLVFTGVLLRPDGQEPIDALTPFATWEFWAVVGGLALARAVSWWWDFIRGREAEAIPPEAAVAEPLRRLFVLQFGVLAGALLIYWAFESAVAGLGVLLTAKVVADVVLAVLERLRAARIVAAVEAGVRPEARPMERSRARRGGRRRRR